MNSQQHFTMSRRTLLNFGVAAAAASAVGGCVSSPMRQEGVKISLAQWSLHRAHWGEMPFYYHLREMSLDELMAKMRSDLASFLNGPLDPLDFAPYARSEFDIDAIEYVSTFYYDKATDQSYLNALKARADDSGVESLLIMVDFEGDLGAPNEAMRLAAVENHKKWVDAASFLGCHSLRVNATSDASLPPEEQAKLVVDGLSKLAEVGASRGTNVIVENHGGPSSNGAWLADVIERVGRDDVGTLPDFGNFKIDQNTTYPYLQGVKELLPYAKGVSAKSYNFDDDGMESNLDYDALMKAIRQSGYNGYIGIEYEGNDLSEDDGIRATKALIERAWANAS